MVADVDLLIEARVVCHSRLKGWDRNVILSVIEELEQFRSWAAETCKQMCVAHRKYGKHAPNCPVADLGLEVDD